MGVYMYPYDSYNYTDSDFGLLSSEIEYWLSNGLILFIGGDLNGRIGDINSLSLNSLKWHYTNNIDTHLHQHGKMLRNICELHQILPINHCRYYDQQFDGYFTYFKANKKSQIDFVLTNNEGRRLIADFNIVRSGWHTSDHLPLVLKLSIPLCMNSMMIMRRSLELKPYLPSQQPLLKIHRYSFNEVRACNAFMVHCGQLNDICLQNPSCPDIIIAEIERYINPILTASKVKKPKFVRMENLVENTVTVCDNLFKKYAECLNDITCDEVAVCESYDNYQKERGVLNRIILDTHEKEYKNIMKINDDHGLWQKINWSGKLECSNSTHPEISELSEHFENLYQPLEVNEMVKLNELTSHVYIPINDDVITERELEFAASSMKTGGGVGLFPTSFKHVNALHTCSVVAPHEYVIFVCLSSETDNVFVTCNPQDRKFVITNQLQGNTNATTACFVI